LLTSTQRGQLDIVLVSPRNPLNIGAAARAMANFGFQHLAVAAPYAPHWQEARSAVGATSVLENARESSSLAEALAACTFVAGTGTLSHRKPDLPIIPLPELAPILARELARDGRAALVFGPEKHGLTRDDLSFCHVLVEIPTDPRQPSMNLGQAVAVCLYELSRPPSATTVSLSEPPRQEPAAASASLDRLAGLIEETMSAANYSPRIMQPANRYDLRLLLRRMHLSNLDTRRILGLFRRILWRMGLPPGRQP
jgi:tRNA/rRNA methyltransferase